MASMIERDVETTSDLSVPVNGHLSSRFLWMVIALGMILGILLMRTFQVGSYQDDALYINLAHALATGAGYVDLMSIGEPSHTFVPPVYPVLLSPLLALLPYEWLLHGNFWPLQILSLVLMFGGFACFAVIVRQRENADWAIIVALASLAPVALGMAWHVMSEAPYFLLSLAALAALTKWTEKRESAHFLVVALVCAALASITRLIGLSLIVAIMLYLWWQLRPLTWLISFVATILPVGLWFFRNAMLGVAATGEYTRQLTPESPATFLKSVSENLVALMTTVAPNTIIPGIGGPQLLAWFAQTGTSPLLMVAGIVITIISALGFVLSLRAKELVWAIELYILLYIGILLATRFALAGGERYLAPVFPFVILYFWLGSKWVLQRTPGFRSPGAVNKAMIVAGVLLLFLYTARGVQAIVQPVRDRLPDVTLGTTWVRQNTPVDAIVMANGPREVYLYGQRKVVPYPSLISDRDLLAREITCGHAEYLLVRPKMAPGAPEWDAATAKILIPLLDEYQAQFELTYSSPDGLVRVYHIAHKGDAGCEALSLMTRSGPAL